MLLPTKNVKLLFWRLGERGRVGGYWSQDRRLFSADPCLGVVLLCVAINLGVTCNGILESKEYPLGCFFGQNSSFCNQMEVLMMLPLSLREVAQKLQGTSGP